MERLGRIPQATWDAIPPEAQAVLAAVVAAFDARIAAQVSRIA